MVFDGFRFGMSTYTSRHCVEAAIIEIIKSDDKEKFLNVAPAFVLLTFPWPSVKHTRWELGLEAGRMHENDSSCTES